LSQALALELLQSFAITPHFVPSLLGEPDYAAPGTYNSYDSQGQLSKQGKREGELCAESLAIVPEKSTSTAYEA